jgi:cell division protease FtsH
LEKGDVEKVIVYNKSEAEVYLTPNTLKEPYHKAVAKDLLNRPTQRTALCF